MKKIEKVHLEILQNGAWVTYLTFIVKLIKENETVKTLLAPLLALLEKTLKDAEESLEEMRSSQWSRGINEADTQRDRMVGGLNNYVRSFLYDIDPAKQRAAESLMKVIDHYGEMAKAPQDQETALINDFLKELNDNHQADIEAIGLSDRCEQLQAANARFVQLLDSRTVEAGNKNPLRMVDIRREGNRLIRMLYTQIELLQLTASTEALSSFAGELNAENARVNDNLKRK
ncbi:MAG: DUF6261 family protein [Prevotellaceae bacterium]|jgi:DnaJ-domain-containing protein 1|nr:DUF6261 family protein [Prevotellaceae bacterium]